MYRINFILYLKRWYIKGVVTNKSNIHHYNNSRGVGSVFSFDFLDSSDEIRVTMFNNDCNRLYSSIHVGHVRYYKTLIIFFLFSNTHMLSM